MEARGVWAVQAANVSATFARLQAEAMTAGLAKNGKPGVVYNQDLMRKASETADLAKKLCEVRPRLVFVEE